jgi:hypothetical protein
MPYKSKKQERYLRAYKPKVAKKFDKDIKKMKKQGQKDREDERLGAEVGGLKRKVKQLKGSRVNPWTKHVASFRKKHKGKSLKDVLKMASKSYKKK